ncbi:LacI family DNA-binding transcriptional regulator [Pelagibacterium montanilacus]|uniref:LacI family DNA-binding transcriptional regulator n=1 Tax=Pelagibacterium montanilacus TaxID=2185280 RepID=UPI001FE95CD9|nr:LacI family DNA-binding transcriptional regulator [Pelagibacterium montanilacus]
MKPGPRLTVHDLAEAAGVSLATVDRVLNGRAGVRPATVEKVEAAIARLGFRRDLGASMLARSRTIGIAFLIPGGTNRFMAKLAEAVEQCGRDVRSQRGQFDLVRIPPMDPSALVAAIEGLDPARHACAAIVAIDTTEVRDAVDNARERGISVITLVSDLPGSGRAGFVGIDNAAAGRTAAALMGRFCPDGGRIGLVVGSLGLSDHVHRIEGFRAVAATDFPGLAIAGPVEGEDAYEGTYQATRDLLAAHPDLSGLYNAGAGNAGLLAAIEDAGLGGRLRVIAHELTGPTRRGLVADRVDVVLDQSPLWEVRAVWTTARRLVLGPDALAPAAPIEIRLFLKHNLIAED